MSLHQTDSIPIDDRTEWLETDGRGGFASGTTSGIRTRRYHAVLLAALTPPTGRVVLVNGFDAFLETADGRFALSAQRYRPDVVFPDGPSHITAFTTEPWPTWEFEVGSGTRVRQELLVEHGIGATVVVWTLMAGDGPAVLRVRPLMSGRDYHSLHHENSAFPFESTMRDAMVRCRTYPGLPDVDIVSNGAYQHAPEWYRAFLYSQERERGLDDTEDLASPGEFTWSLSPGERATWMLRPAGPEPVEPRSPGAAEALALQVQDLERRRRRAFRGPLDRAADAYLVQRGRGRSIVAGYPWFTDWGRDTFIAIRGLCLATGRRDEARDILVEWAGAVSEGMLPNRFPDGGEAPEFNSVDASLWFIVAAHELIQGERSGRGVLSGEQRQALETAVSAIVTGYAEGTRFGIRMEGDGLLAAGVAGLQLTWMDARVGDRVITPRIGKPVEIQALWLNALHVAASLDPRWIEAFESGLRAFGDRFWNEDTGHLADVVDVDHAPGTRDNTMRPNQILAVGGLPLALVDGARARRIVDAVERDLVTPLGLRSLAPIEPGYAPRYEGDSSARDGAYHQGTVWPWLLGPFVEAWVRVRGNTRDAQHEARRRFLEPVMTHLGLAGLGHISEIADADSPFTPKGCPFQAWSLGELIRLDRIVLAKNRRLAPEAKATATPPRRRLRRPTPV